MAAIRSLMNLYGRFAPVRLKPVYPYDHISQIGDPVLRRVAEPVDMNKIPSWEIRKVTMQMERVLNSYKCVGLAAPQIGVSKRIIILEYKRSYNAGLSDDFLKNRQISVLPFTVYINPTMKVLDYTIITHPEGCESIKGFEAVVPRFQAVEVTGYNLEGKLITHQYEGWPARIAQHEIDHLGGKFYTDIMERTTFQCVCWEEINRARGKLEIPYYPSR